MNIYEKINPTFITEPSDLKRSIILFDPAEVYSRITINPYKRYQSISIGAMFPTIEKGICACGCGRKLHGRQTRWYDGENCPKLPLGVNAIIKGDLNYINRLMRYFHKHECCVCGCQPYVIEKSWVDGIQVDHIIGVADGGGGGWLSNYRFVCHRCHAKKTAYDNKVRKHKIISSNNLALF
jgi:5-methylcytosine-specific restriction endonuclease McrA